jgi:hypothetical protein
MKMLLKFHFITQFLNLSISFSTIFLTNIFPYPPPVFCRASRTKCADTAETQRDCYDRVSDLRDPRIGVARSGSGRVPRKGFTPAKKRSCDRDVAPYGRQRGYRGPSRWRTSSANTFWVEAMVSKGIRGMLNCWRPVTSPIRHLVL